MRLHYFQHVPFEGLGSMTEWARKRSATISVTRWFAGETAPSLETFDLLVVLGGPMSVNDEREHAWLAAEKRAIADAMAAGKRVLGICLGAQLLANVLGATIAHNPQKEIGWFPVELTEAARASHLFRQMPPTIEAFHWHGETFDLPEGAVWLAQSAACRNQAFAYHDRVIGLQFHLETTPQSAEQLITNCGAELVAAPFIQPAKFMLADIARFAAINRLMSELLDAFVVSLS